MKNLGPFDAARREKLLLECQQTPLDLVIIGGGITGAGVLRDATLRGLRAVLFEKDDFAWGTSGRSSKLIHGGVRYLETGNIGLVYEGLRERRRMLELAPDLVQPLPFLFPVYKGLGKPFPMIAAGVLLYHFLAMFQDLGHPKLWGKKKTLVAEPMLRAEGLSGSALYYDALTDDAALTVATIRSAREAGGMALNHAKAFGLLEEKKRIVGVRLRDQLTEKEYSVRARWVVNTTGPWVDAFRGEVGLAAPVLRPTKGTHLVLDQQKVKISNAVVMISPTDKRVTFCIPWKGHIVVGTTDTDYQGSPDQAAADDSDVRYLLNCTNYYFPTAKLTPTDVVSTFAGIRPLIRGKLKLGKAHPSKVSREHQIFSERSGCMTLAGGKLTSFRKMAEQAVDWLTKREDDWKEKIHQHPTRSTPYPKIESADDEPELIPGSGIRWSQIVSGVDHDLAATISDLLCRRTPVSLLDPKHGAGWVEQVAKLLSERLGLSTEEISRQISEYPEVIRQAEKGLERKPD